MLRSDFTEVLTAAILSAADQSAFSLRYDVVTPQREYPIVMPPKASTMGVATEYVVPCTWATIGALTVPLVAARKAPVVECVWITLGEPLFASSRTLASAFRVNGLPTLWTMTPSSSRGQ